MTFTPPPRKPWTMRQKAEILARHCRCAECGGPFDGLDDIDFDHKFQRAISADDSIENGTPLHRRDKGGCHAAKTRRDARDRAKQNRHERKEAERPHAKRSVDKPKLQLKGKHQWGKRKLSQGGGPDPKRSKKRRKSSLRRRPIFTTHKPV